MRLVELHTSELDGGRVHCDGGGRLVGRLGRRVLIAKQSGAPLVGLLGELKLGFGIGELGAIDRIFEREKWRSLLDRLPFLEMNLLEPPRDFRTDRNRLVGEDSADGRLPARSTARP